MAVTVAFRLQALPKFPVGTVVKVFPNEQFSGSGPQPGDAPVGVEEVSNGVVPAKGIVIFEGLEPDTRYWAGALVNGKWEWKQIRSPPASDSSSSTSGPVTTFNGRQGPTLLPQAGDYTFADVGAYPLEEEVEEVHVKGDLTLPTPQVVQGLVLILETPAPTITVWSAIPKKGSQDIDFVQDATGNRVPKLKAQGTDKLAYVGVIPPTFSTAPNYRDAIVLRCRRPGIIDVLEVGKHLA